MFRLQSFCIFLFLFAFHTISGANQSFTLSDDLEMHIIEGVDFNWKSVNLENTYTDAVVVCTHHVPDKTADSVVRINYSGTPITTGFQVKIQRGTNTVPGYDADVYCTISDEGSFTEPFNYIADKVVTNNALRPNGNGGPKEITSVGASGLAGPITVIGQVMSYDDNDPRATVFWSSACNNRKDPPNVNSVCVSKHASRNNIQPKVETLGYIIAEQGKYVRPNFILEVVRGGNTISDILKADAPFTYDTSDEDYVYATATQAGENGGDGSWVILFGDDPVGEMLKLALDEFSYNSDRAHTNEQVDFWVMLPLYPQVNLKKEVAVIWDPINGNSNPKAIQGSVLEYTITAKNTDRGAVDSDTIVIHDSIAADVKLCVPVSPAVPECEAPSVDVGTSGLSSGSIAYSQNSGADNYTYSPVADSDGADASVNKIRVSTQGAFSGDSSGGTSPPEFSVKFRVIKK